MASKMVDLLLNNARRNLLILVLLVGSVVSFTSLALAQGNVLSDPPTAYNLVQGWYEGRQTFYYEFGTNSSATDDGLNVVTAPIYVFITGFDADGNPQVVDGQLNIVDVIPGDEGYSDLWEVTFVTVPEDYVANSITSADEVLAGGFELTVPGVLVNCPIIPAGSTLESADDAPVVQGWYKGQEISYFDFGPNIQATAPIYAFISGFDGDGNPQFVEGQNNVVGVIPGDDGYSAFWYVNLVQVPANYTANSITSEADVLASGYDIVQPGLLVNCPIVRTDAATPVQLPDTGGAQSGLMLWSILIASGFALVSLGLFVKTRNAANAKIV